MKIFLIIMSILTIIIAASSMANKLKNSESKEGIGFDFFCLCTAIIVYTYFVLTKLQEVF